MKTLIFPSIKYLYRQSRLSPFLWKSAFFFYKRKPLHEWDAWFCEICGIEMPGKREQNLRGGVLLEALEKTNSVQGHVAECGVFQGASLIPIAYHTQKNNPSKKVYAFDSFVGFDEKVHNPKDQGELPSAKKKVGGFGNTSKNYVDRKVSVFGLEKTVLTVPGFFEDTLKQVKDERFSFVYLDCDLYDSYMVCLEFFYPRMNPGGVILFDEYCEPVWPGATKAIDEFLLDKPEKCIKLGIGSAAKYYITKK